MSRHVSILRLGGETIRIPLDDEIVEDFREQAYGIQQKSRNRRKTNYARFISVTLLQAVTFR